jgi:hypothetical protein
MGITSCLSNLFSLRLRGKIFRPSNPQGGGYNLLSLQPTSHQLMGKIPSNPQGDGYNLLSLQPTSLQVMGKIFFVPLTHMVMGIIFCLLSKPAEVLILLYF